MLYTCVFILLRLSGEREFSVLLNRPYLPNTLPLPDLAPLTAGGAAGAGASYADVLLIVAHKLIVSSATHLDALLNVLLTVLCNISPYITRLALVSR